MTTLIIRHSFNHNGHRTAKMSLSREDDGTVKVWVSLGEKSNMIKLDDAAQHKIIEFLKK